MRQEKACHQVNEAGDLKDKCKSNSTTNLLKQKVGDGASAKSKCGCNSFASVKQRSRGIWLGILVRLGIDEKFLNKRHCPCPGCGGKDRFRFTDRSGDGCYICNQCGAGDGFRLLQIAFDWSAKESLEQVASLVPLSCMNCEGEVRTLKTRAPRRMADKPAKEIKSEQEKLRRMEWLRDKIWGETIAVAPGHPVHTYLTKTRRLPLRRIPQDLRYHPALGYYEYDGKRSEKVGEFPAMVAAIRDVRGVILSLHRTYLTPEGKKLGDVDKSCTTRKLMPCFDIAGGAIHLGEPGEELVIAEGIETALAASVLSDLPAWSAVTALGMERVELPGIVKTVYLCVDNDPAGKRSSLNLSRRILAQGKNAVLVDASLVLSSKGSDWADIFAVEVA